MVADENVLFQKRNINFLFRNVLAHHILIVNPLAASLFELQFHFPSFYF